MVYNKGMSEIKEYLRKIGSVGGRVVVKKYGSEYMSLLGKKGGKKSGQKRRARKIKKQAPVEKSA